MFQVHDEDDVDDYGVGDVMVMMMMMMMIMMMMICLFPVLLQVTNISN